jgi:glycosyltransferase involved in cell wall biosynthesis
MRVLICHYNPDAGGGAESAVRDQKRALELCGHEAHVTYEHPEKAWGALKPDVLHFHTIHVSMGLAPLVWAQEQGIAHCLSLHDYWPFCGDRMLMKAGANPHGTSDEPCSAVEGLCDGQCANRATPMTVRAIVNGSPLVVFNRYSEAIYRRHGIQPAAVIAHSIDTDFFSPDYAQRENPPVVAVTCAWPGYNTKGLHILREALRLVGNRARVITGVPRERVRDELRKASIFVFPSTYQETWGLSLTEAMACGCACIASDVAGSRAQIQHGATGLLFPNRDPHALAGHLRYLLSEHDEMCRLGRNAREWAAEHCNLERMGRDYTAFYEAVIDGTSRDDDADHTAATADR